MLVTNVIDYDIVNYKKPAMFIGTSKCSMKCGKECANKSLMRGEAVYLSEERLIELYEMNPLTKAVVLGGLEPFDSFIETFAFVKRFRENTEDDIVIYTGYEPHEIKEYIKHLQQFKNIIVKFGRYIPALGGRYDGVLGVELASRNQRAEVIS